MASAAYNSRPSRESVSKRIGEKATKWIWTRDNSSCAYCGCGLIPGRGAHLDHLNPRANGGEDLITNLVLSCERCNSARQDMSLVQWAAYSSRVYGLRFSPSKMLAKASTPVPSQYAGRGKAWFGLKVALGDCTCSYQTFL